MTTSAGSADTDIHQISEVLEAANSILLRHPDLQLSCQKLRLESCLGIPPVDRTPGYNRTLQKAAADLTATVQLHLNSEVEAVGRLFFLGE